MEIPPEISVIRIQAVRLARMDQGTSDEKAALKIRLQEWAAQLSALQHQPLPPDLARELTLSIAELHLLALQMDELAWDRLQDRLLEAVVRL